MTRSPPEHSHSLVLAEAIACVARAPRLLVASDFDGTLAPLVDRPEHADPNPRAIAALRRLCASPGVRAAIISGRPRASLHAMLAGIGLELVLIGSHGAETPWAPDHSPGDFDIEAARAIADDAVQRLPGSWIEHKPAGIAWHVRGCETNLTVPMLQQVAANLSQVTDGQVLFGHQVLECLPKGVSKVRAFEFLRREWDPDCSIFFGDDKPDAEVFAALTPGDVGVAVGVPRAGAAWTVASTSHVATLLEQLADERERWNRSRPQL